MTHEILGSVLNSAVELQVLAIGIALGVVIALLWENHRTVAMFILGFTIAMTVGQTLTPWAPSYAASVAERPLATKPWYVLVPMTLVLYLGVPILDRIRTRGAIP